MASLFAALTPEQTAQYKESRQQHKQLQRVLKCPECDTDPGSSEPKVMEDPIEGNLVCGKCGLIVEQYVDTRSEWRTFSNDMGGTDDPSRVGGPVDPNADSATAHDIIIGKMDGGTGIAKELNRAHTKTMMTDRERTTQEALKKITNLCDRGGYPLTVIDTAKHLFRGAETRIRGVKTEALIASAIHIACRQHSIGRSMNETCALTGVNRIELYGAFKKMKALVESNKPQQTSGAVDYIERHCEQLDLSKEVTRAAKYITQKVNELGLAASKQPTTVCAAAIYMASQLSDTPKQPRDIWPVVGPVEATIRSAYKDFYPHRHKLIPTDFQLSRSIDDLPTS